MKTDKIKKSFYGMTTLGEKGQVVVPASARERMKLEKGEKLLAFSFDEDMLILYKIDGLEKFASHLGEKLKDINSIIRKSNK